MIQQGDQYALPIIVRLKGEIITPTNCSDLRIKINNTTYYYDGGEGDITFNSTNQTWCYPLTEEMTLKYNKIAKVQVGVKINDEIINTETKEVSIGESILKDEW